MMSSFIENAAAVKIQDSSAPNPVSFAYGAASVLHAPPKMQTPPLKISEAVPVSVYQPATVVVAPPAAEVLSQFPKAEAQSNGNGSNGSLKRRRGRPRKYAPGMDGTVVNASPVSSVAPQLQSGVGSVGGASVGGVGGGSVGGAPVGGALAGSVGGGSVGGGSVGGALAGSGGGAIAESGGGALGQSGGGSVGSGKRGRGRPAGSRGKHRASPVLPFNVSPTVSGLAGVGFTPHIVIVQPGMDVLARLMSFSQFSSQAVCVLSANGTVGSVTLQQSSSSGGTVTYEGRFEILSISGSFLLAESGGQRSRSGGLSVSLAGPDGSVLGGSVAGLLIAATPVQVVVGTFMAATQQPTKPGYNVSAPPKHVSSVGGSPPSRATLSESSGGPASPLNNSTGGCNNSNQQNVSTVAWS